MIRKTRPDSDPPAVPPEVSPAPARKVSQEFADDSPLPPQSGIEEVDDFRDMNSLDGVLADYIAQEKLDETAYRASLYKYDKVNKQKQHLVDFSVGSVMSANDIGTAMGSGEYRYVITWPNRRTSDNTPYCKAFKINIGETYDLKRMYANPPPLPGTAAPSGPAPDPINQALQLVGALVTLNRAGGQEQSSPERKTVESAQSMLAFQTMMQQMSVQHLEFMKEVKRKFLSGDSDTYENEEVDEVDNSEGNELVKTVKELAIQFLPKLLGDGPGAKVTAGVVRSLPQFKKIVKDGPTFAHLLDELEKEFGKKKVTAVCERLKVSRP